MRLVSTFCLAVAMAGCKAPSSEKSGAAGATKPAPPEGETATDSATTTATTTGTDSSIEEAGSDDDDVETGTVALETGDVTIELRAISSTADFALANAEANAEVQAPGTLQIMAGLMPWRAIVAEGDIGSSGIKASSIASGPADGFKIRVHRIKLSGTPATQLRLKADTVAFDEEMLAAIPDLSAEQLATLQGMLGQEYPSLDALANALRDTGLDEAQMSALASSVDNGDGGDQSELQREVTIFESDTGVELSLESSSLDLGDLASALAVPVGSYASIELELATKAAIKGCVQADFGTVMNDGVPIAAGEHRYCTKAGFSLFDTVDAAQKQNATFEVGLADDAAPEWYTIDLRRGPDGSSYPLDGTTQVKYEFETPLVVEAGAALGLTAVVDLNRMLRYYNRARTTPPNPGMPSDVSYFFTTVFEQSFAVFVGRPGRIYGYALVADACAVDQYDASLAQCGPSNNAVQPNAAWMTIVTRPDGSPQRISLMPDDDNGLTINKGDTRGVAQPITAGSAGGLVNINYALGDENTGTIIDFPANLEAAAIGDVIDGTTFEFGDHLGPVTFTRKL